MLGDMKAKGEKMLDDETQLFAKYTEFVDDQSRELGYQMKTAQSNIEKLLAFIEDADNKVATLGDEITELDDDIARMEGEKKAATAIRESEKAEFEKTELDYSESVDAIQRATQVLGSQAYDRPQAEMLLQKMSQKTPGMGRVLDALLQEGSSGASASDGAPAVAGYDFQSGGIVEMLGGLLKKFKGELEEVQTEESNKAHYYSLEMIHLSDTIAQSKADREEKQSLKGKTAAASAKAKGDLAETKEELAADQKFFADMEATYTTKKATYEENQQVRKQELEALSKAVEIISSPEVSDSYAGHINLAQVPARTLGRAPSLLQLGRSQAALRGADARDRAANFLKRRAGALNSKALAKFAAGMAGNPFEKVIDMIETMLAKLKEEAAAEVEHKAWCDEQLKENKLKRNKKTSAVQKLLAEIEGLQSDIASMGEEIDTLVEEQASLAKAMKEATAQRAAEKSKNTEAISDAKAGQAAVQSALEVLREFYSSQASMLQRGKRQIPAMEAYKGMQSSKGGPIGMLEVIKTDFARLEADTTSAEKQAVRVYDEFMEDAKADKEEKHKEEVRVKLAKDDAEFKVSELKKDLAANEDELSKANKYYDELKPLCTQVHVSYEERVRQREQELAALNEAYEILGQKGA
jgi:DNA repair exonuclease SbcCD ATPase subunit